MRIQIALIFSGSLLHVNALQAKLLGEDVLSVARAFDLLIRVDSFCVSLQGGHARLRSLFLHF